MLFHLCLSRANHLDQPLKRFEHDQSRTIRLWSIRETFCIFGLKQVISAFVRASPLTEFFSEAVTFLGDQERDRNLYAIPGLDYVAHEDVIPYTVIQSSRGKHSCWLECLQSTERVPIEHELFDKFLLHDPEASTCWYQWKLIDRKDSFSLAPNYIPREYLKTWQERHHIWLELSDVSKDVTHQIRVTVIPFYM